MPSSGKAKSRSRDDTWGATELTSTLQDIMVEEGTKRHGEKSRHREREADSGRRERRHGDREEEKDGLRHQQKRKDGDDNKTEHDKGEDRSRKQREKLKDKDRPREKDRDDRRKEVESGEKRDNEKSKDRERRHDRKRGKDRHEDDERNHDRDRDQERRQKEKYDNEKERDEDSERHKNRERHREERGKHETKNRDNEREKRRYEDRSKQRSKEDRGKRREERHKERSSHKENVEDRRQDERAQDKDHHKRDDDDGDDRDKRRADRKRREDERNKSHESDRRRSHRDENTESDKSRRHKDERQESERSRRHKDERQESDRSGRHKDERQESERSRRHKDERHESERSKRHKEENRESERTRRHKDENRGEDHERSKRREGNKGKEKEKDLDSDEEREKRRQERRRRKEEGKESTKSEKNAEDRRNHRDKRRDSEKDEVVEEIEESVSEVAPVPETQDDDEGYDDYEEDFEDYEEDDFEVDEDEEDENVQNFDNSELAELRRAIAEENEAVGRKENGSRSEASSASTRPTTSASRRTLVNFVAAKQRQISDKVAQRTKKRGEELMKLIELDTVNFDLLDMPPVKDYDRYIRHFGKSNTRQMACQTNEDNLDREVQTDDVESCERWTQYPAEGVLSCGVASGDVSLEQQSLRLHELMQSSRLTQFLEEASQLIVTLLEEDLAEIAGGSLRSNQRHIIFSDGYTQLNTDLSFLNGRPVVKVEIHPVQTQFLMTVHSLFSVTKDDLLSRRGLLCIWNVNAPTRPVKVLSCQPQPCACCWSPFKATLAFSGSEDGSILVWDLREPSSMHQKLAVGEDTWVVRVPTYSTDGVQTDESHQSRVVAMQPIISHENEAAAQSDRQGLSSGSFQVASLEEKGILHFWVVLEVDKSPASGSESDLGLVPSGRLKLIKSSSISLVAPSRGLGVPSSLRAHCFRLNPLDPNHIFIGTDAGMVLHSSRHQSKVCPRSYYAEIDVPVDIVAVDFSPFAIPCFLVACADGSIRLHKTSSEFPLAEWSNSTNGMEIAALAWSHNKPSVFFVVDVTSKVYVWSLLERDGSPIKIEQFSNGRLTALSISNGTISSTLGSPARRPEMVLTNEQGGIEVHRLHKNFCVAAEGELEAMMSLMDSLS